MNEPARRIRPLDRVLIATLVPLFLVVLALKVWSGIDAETSWIGMAVSSASAGGYPVVEQLIGARTEGGSLEVGDRLVRADDRSLQGASMMDFITRATPLARRPEGVRIEIARGDERFEATLFATPGFPRWLGIPWAVVSVATALIILLRKPEWRCARTYFVGVLFGGVFFLSGAMGFDEIAFGARYLALATLPVFMGAQISMFWNFTASAAPLRSWQRAQSWALGAALFAGGAAFLWLPRPAAGIGLNAQALLLVVALVSMVAGLTRAYRRSDGGERRQIRWVLLSLYVASLPWIFVLAVGVLGGQKGLMLTSVYVASFAMVAAPIGLLVSVLGYRLLDVDRLIGATTAYTIMGVILIGVALQLLPRAAEALSSATDLAPATSQWALALGVALVVVQGQRRLRPWLDRRMFADRVAVETGLATLVAELGGCRSASELLRLSGERIDALLRPGSLAVYARDGLAFTPVYARGAAIPPAFEADSPLVKTLEVRGQPLVASVAALDPFDRAALATLGAEVITPVRRAGTLTAFTCLGGKRSGDIYTPAELALLAAVASASAEVLHRLGDGELLEHARAMHESMRRYVPGAIAERVESGRAVDAGEREVTVLFVDLRGYSSYAEKRRAEEVFSTVNENTERVSRIVRARGGTVVEFNGDGMMAVFGAPEALVGKERAAVEAAREIVDSMPRDLSVGIGIASGQAYAGNIRAADRWIWSVIGDTTNLAARLQALTRELDASIATDTPTRLAAGYVCADFVRHGDVSIRGRAQRVDVFALPLARPAAAA